MCWHYFVANKPSSNYKVTVVYDSNFTEFNRTSTVASVVSKKTSPAPDQPMATAAEFELILPFIFGILVILSLSLVVFYYKLPEQPYQLSAKQEQTTPEKGANM